jgi:hypothetical protein
MKEKIDLLDVKMIILSYKEQLRPTVTYDDIAEVVNKNKHLIEMQDNGWSDKPCITIDLRKERI